MPAFLAVTAAISVAVSLKNHLLLFERPFVKRFAVCYRTMVWPVLSVLSVCDVGLLWPNSWMDQDATWCGGRPRSRPCVRWGPSSPQKGHSPPPIYSPCLLWPNGWMDQDATWYGGGLGPGDIVSDWVPAPQKRGTAAPTFRSMSIMANRSPVSATAELLFGSLSLGILCVCVSIGLFL